MTGNLTAFNDDSGRDVLPAMEVQFPGRRNADGSVSCNFMPPIRSPMFGPFLRLHAGRYYLEITARLGPQLLQKDHPVFGVEIIAQNRIVRGWGDFTVTELARGPQRIYFDVPRHMAIESGADAPFEFRFTSFGVSAFTIQKLVLVSVPASEAQEPVTMVWRLLGRMKRYPLSRHVSMSRFSIPLLKFGEPLAPFYLPAGLFSLELGAHIKGPSKAEGEALDVRLMTRDRQQILGEVFNARDLSSGKLSILFEMPSDLAYDAGSPQRLHVEIRQLGQARIDIETLEIKQVEPDKVQSPSLTKRASKPTGSKKRILIFGNCQAGILANAMRNQSAFSRQFSVRHHSLELPANLHEQGRKDLEECDILLVQDIREWEHYPLKNHVPDNLQTIRYPCIRFASPWPFDAFNGPDDRFARDKDYPNFEFTYFDGVLARLRKEIPDHEARFQAYRDLSIKGVIDPKRLHVFEEKRLQAMDQKFSIDIGDFILENFRKQSVFYTTAHPNGAIFRMLLKYIARELGIRQWILPSRRLDALKNLEIPVHPLVAKSLDLKWATDATQYRIRGKKITWEEYVRHYILYYG